MLTVLLSPISICCHRGVVLIDDLLIHSSDQCSHHHADIQISTSNLFLHVSVLRCVCVCVMILLENVLDWKSSDMDWSPLDNVG